MAEKRSSPPEPASATRAHQNEVAREHRHVNTDTEAGTVSVTRYDSSGTWLIVLRGEHDISTVPLLAEHTRQIWVDCGRVVVDLSPASFIDCSTIGWLLQTRNSLADVGTCALRVVVGAGGEGVASRVFDVLDLRDQFACYPTRQQALVRAP
jgi:anti-anti-sigma factor